MPHVPVENVKDINGKSLRREHYELLRDLGIEIVMYNLKTYEDNSTTGAHKTTSGKMSYGFEIYGAIYEQVDFDELHDLLLLMKTVKSSKSPAVQDALDQLKMVIGMTELKRNE